MDNGYSWVARWQDPMTLLPSGISRVEFPTADDARDDALRHSPLRAEITIRAPDGGVIEVIPARFCPPAAVAPRLTA
jgi:hypothetical protein